MLPAKADSWQTDRKQLVLLHELAHIKRWDYLLQLITRLACALYWFNPLIWIAFNRMVTEREQACDDLVLSAGPEPTDYAEGLLRIVSSLQPAGLKASVAIAMARPSKLEARLRVILDATRNRKRLTGTGIIAGVLTIAGVLLPLASMQPKVEAEDKPADSVINDDLEKGDNSAADENVGSVNGERVIHFPKDRSVGKLMIQDANIKKQIQTFHSKMYGAVNWYGVEYLCEAQGDVMVPAGKIVGLLLDNKAVNDLSPLRHLAPDDLYMLSNPMILPQDAPVADRCMPFIAHLTGLKDLQLFSTKLTNKGLRHITKLQALERLTLPNGMTDKGLSYVAQLKSLKSLYFMENRVTNTGLRRYLPALTNLEELTLWGERIDGAGLEHLSVLKSLKYLTLAGPCCTDEAMVHIRNIPSLKILSVMNQKTITDEGLRRLSGHPGLEHLSLYDTGITNKGLVYLESMSSLKKLNIGNRNNDPKNPPISDAGMVSISKLKGLEYLDLPNCGITDNGLAHISKLKKLKHLWVCGSSNSPLTDTALKHVSKLENLEFLLIFGTGITNSGMDDLAKLSKLRELRLMADSITNEGLAKLKTLKSLERLSLTCKKVTISGLSGLNALEHLSDLEIDSIKQDNRGMDISGLTNLEELRLRLNIARKGKELIYDKLSDKDLACLAKLKKLKFLAWLPRNSMVTDAGIAYLKDLSNMRELQGGSPYLTDKSFSYLAKMKTLQSVTITGNFTDDGLGYLEELKALRSLKIYSANNFSQTARDRLRDNLPNLGIFIADQDRSIGGKTKPLPQKKKSSVMAPSFSLKTLDGKELKLADYRGKAVMLYF